MFGGPVGWRFGAVDICEMCLAFEHGERDVIAPLCLRQGQNGLDLVHFRG